MKVSLCAVPCVEEFLCQVWEIAILIDGRVNMNFAVAETTLHSTPSCNETLTAVPKQSKAPSNVIARSNCTFPCCNTNKENGRETWRISNTAQMIEFVNVTICVIHHLSSNIFLFPMPLHVPYGLRGLLSRLWPKCNRLVKLGRPWGAVTLSGWDVLGWRRCLTLWHTQPPVRRSEPPMYLLLVLYFCQ
jgi:hypothetical protein